MRHFRKIINAPATHVWRLITDTHSWPLWGPSVQNVECPERFIRGGSTGRIRTPFGIWLPFVVEGFEPGRYWDWRVGGIAATGHQVEPRGRHESVLSFSVPIWAAGYGIVCRLALTRIENLLPACDIDD
ncbi:MAG: SRPBCC family protein [Desulfobacterales bacterium]|jgi:hypothetical protein